MLKHIVFDFGGVILDLDGVHTGYPDNLAEIFGCSLDEAQTIWSENKTLVITGQETPKQFLTRVKNELHLGFNIEAAVRFWEKRNQITKERIDWKLVALIQQLTEKYQIHMLTDQIKLDNGASEWKQEFEQYFDSILRSYEQGVRKPDAAAFRNLLNKIGAQPDEVFFVDDLQNNCDAATALGIRSHRYRYTEYQTLQELV